jgi:hypothetical protein
MVKRTSPTKTKRLIHFQSNVEMYKSAGNGYVVALFEPFLSKSTRSCFSRVSSNDNGNLVFVMSAKDCAEVFDESRFVQNC